MSHRYSREKSVDKDDFKDDRSSYDSRERNNNYSHHREEHHRSHRNLDNDTGLHLRSDDTDRSRRHYKHSREENDEINSHSNQLDDNYSMMTEENNKAGINDKQTQRVLHDDNNKIQKNDVYKYENYKINARSMENGELEEEIKSEEVNSNKNSLSKLESFSSKNVRYNVGKVYTQSEENEATLKTTSRSENDVIYKMNSVSSKNANRTSVVNTSKSILPSELEDKDSCIQISENASAEEIYDALCVYHDVPVQDNYMKGSTEGISRTNNKNVRVLLPPGWEKVEYQGSTVYLDHISREAHEEAPWVVWRRRAEKYNFAM